MGLSPLRALQSDSLFEVMPESKYKPHTPLHFNSSVLFPTWKCFSFQDEEPITSLSDWLFRSTKCGLTPHNSHDSLGERRSNDAERRQICMTGGELFSTQVSIQLKFNPTRTVEQFNTELRKWQENISLMRQAISGSLLQLNCCFYSISTLPPSCWNFLSQIP